MNEYEQKKQTKEAERAKSERAKTIKSTGKNFLLIIAAVAVVGYLGFRAVSGGPADDGTAVLISRTGIHWHPTLDITVNGKKEVIPADIGIGTVHADIHTHDDTGIIHIEDAGLVTTDDTKLKKFFDIWGKTFNSECIFEYCSGPDGTLKMLVNGVQNSEYENYEMKDGDKIEIIFGKEPLADNSSSSAE